MNGRMTISLSKAMEKEMNKMISNDLLEVRTKSEILRNSFLVYRLIVDELLKSNKLVIANQDNEILKEIVIKQ